MNIKPNSKTVLLIFSSLSTALICILSQIVIPTPLMPVTLQVFAITLAGFTLPFKYSLLSVLAYIFLGGIGVPVFSNFSGGLHHLFGQNGGFIIGFLFLSVCCSLSSKLKNDFKKLCLGFLGVLLMSICGILYFCFFTATKVFNFINLIFVFMFIKDIILCISAFYISKNIKKRTS